MTEANETRRPLLTALLGMSIWTAGEVVARRFLAPRVARVADDDLLGDMVVSLLTIVPLGWGIAKVGERTGFERERREYEWTPRAVGGGVLAGIAGFVSLGLTVRIDGLLFGSVEDTEVLTEDTPLPAAVSLLVVNGVVAPLTEEFVWRGIVQTALVERFDTVTGITLTGLSFSLKHAVVDRSLNRTTTLFGLGSIFAVARDYLGTGASTVAHVVVNLPGSLVAIVVKHSK